MDIIKTDLPKAQEIAQVKYRRASTENKLGAEKQSDTKLTIDKMIALPMHSDEGIARRDAVMELNNQIKTDINSASDEIELKKVLVDNGLA